MSITISLGDRVKLPSNFVNNQLIFEPTSVDLDRPSAYDNSSLTIYNNVGDHIFHISFRRYDDVIILNARLKDGAWGAEVRRTILERAFGPTVVPAKIVVRDVQDAYQVFINKNYLCTFKKRIGGEGERVSYEILDGQETSIFSNSITVSVQ